MRTLPAISRGQLLLTAGALLSLTLATLCYSLASASYHTLWEEASCYALVIRPVKQYALTWAALPLCVGAGLCAVLFPRADNAPLPQTLVKASLLCLTGVATMFVLFTLAWIHFDQPSAVKPDESYCLPALAD